MEIIVYYNIDAILIGDPQIKKVPILLCITTDFDLQTALETGTIDPALKDWLKAELTGLWEHLGREESIADFDLAPHGPMWVTTTTEENLDWQEITKTMGVHEPEFVELHTLQNGQEALRIGFLADNDHMPLLYALIDCLHPEVAAWLKEYCGDMDEQISEWPIDEPF